VITAFNWYFEKREDQARAAVSVGCNRNDCPHLSWVGAGKNNGLALLHRPASRERTTAFAIKTAWSGD
jgi:hypothetical protein